MIVGQIALPTHPDLGAKLGVRPADSPARTPGTGGPDGFIAALRRRSGGDTNANPRGNDRATDLRTDAQEPSSDAADADQRTQDVEANSEQDRLDTDDHDERIAPDDARPTEDDNATPIDKKTDSDPTDTEGASTSDEARDSESATAETKDAKDATPAKAEHTSPNQTATKTQPLEVPGTPDRKGADAPAARKGEADAPPPADDAKPGSDADKGSDAENAVARSRARERASLHWKPDQAGASSTSNASAKRATTTDSDAAPAAGGDARQPALADSTPAQATAAQPTDPSTDRTPARETTATQSTTHPTDTTDPATRHTDAHHDGDTTKDQPDQRGNEAQSVRTRADSPTGAKPQPQPDSLFRLTLDNASNSANAAKATTGSARTTTTPQTPDRAFLTGLTRGIGAVLNQKGGALTMRLTPASLGSVRIQMTIKGGQVGVELEAASARAHDLLRSQLPALKQSLEAKGLTVERLGVQLSPTAHQGHAGSGADHQGATGGRPEDPGAHHDAGDGRSRGARDGNPDAHDGGRGGDPHSSAFENLFAGLADEPDASDAASIRLGLDAVV